MKLLDTAGVTTLWGKVKDHVKTSIDSQQFKTINGTSVKGAGDIHIDLTLYKVVSALPTSGIDATKIYLVKDSSVDGNLYSEYMYVDEKWEKLGSFRSSVDLEPYAKTDYVNAQLATKVNKQSGKGLSTNDFTTAEKNKLANISAGANNYSLPLATSDVRGGAKIGYTTNSSNRNYAVQLSNEQMYVNVPWTDTNTTYGLATSTNNGIMSAGDKAKLDSIAAITDTKLKSIIHDVSSLCKFNSANSIENCVYGRINFMHPFDTEINLDSIRNKEGIIIFAYLQDQSNITCSNGFLYNEDSVDQKVVGAGTFLITCYAGVLVVLSL